MLNRRGLRTETHVVNCDLLGCESFEVDELTAATWMI